MADLISRKLALKEVNDFRNGIFHDENLTKDNKHDWEAAYCMGKLYDNIYSIPRSNNGEVDYCDDEATQIVEDIEGWGGQTHTCSCCKKIIPFIDWCQPFCSGCGSHFDNYKEFCADDKEEEGKENEG